MASGDVIVIGAGVIGCSIAFELAKAGWSPVVVDKLPASGYGSTSASSAIVRSFYSTEAGSAMAWESTQVWNRWADYVEHADERGAAVYRQTGCLLINGKDDAFVSLIRKVMTDIGVPFESWDVDALARKLPWLDLHLYGPPRHPDEAGFAEAGEALVEGALYFPQAGYVNDPQLAAHNLQRAAEAHGATFRFNAQVSAIRQSNGRVDGVELADGTSLPAPVVVNVGGPHSGGINRLAGVDKTMTVRHRPLRKEVCYLPGPSDVDLESQGLFIADMDVGGYCRPETGNKLVIGSTEPACDDLTWIDDPDDYNTAFSNQWTVQAMRMAMRIPTLGIPGQASGTVALYDASEDWIPIYDRSDLPGYYMACGTSGNQFKNAPVAGALMATLIGTCENGHDHDQEPVLFDLPETGRTLDLGNFSRRRSIHRESSFSVLG
ncbi:MAG: FAD-binding oxidoreductase [Alphaproteobacteria bacterium]|jgi:sarcosine oxidase, subunit beta|nr:FAD-binding oxidoreductase [Alphaproteobacteria bacterium]MBT4966124.1 FAD-binding oxidoreductase [Alphaproteobacteria bacterium]MBT5159416.1 FAD-binding oxidoreductase [Alphaproteobacteria bacterium]MBT5917909.1 FAD-binding oxidoreductase [Alphaproteobacteria bacterium]MBT6386514.1 FAD-binding oxidoreductase [Alphaproteobacteria bacterium]